MKKTLLIAAIAAMAAVSCQKENSEKVLNRTISVTAETLPMTKVSVKDGVQPVWTAGEKASLISMTDYASKGTYSLQESDIAQDGSRARFSFGAVANGSYRIISPEPSSVSSEGVVFNIPAAQTQKELGISGSRACLVGGVKGSSDGVLADLVIDSETGEYDAYFRLAGALLQFNIYDSSNKAAGEKIKSVSISATDANLSGSMTVSYDGKLKSVSGTGSSVTVTVNNLSFSNAYTQNS